VIFFEKYKRYFQWSIPVLAFLLYANTIPNDYNMDDELVTINHRNTSRGLSAISDIFSQYYYEDEMGYKYEYRPIAHLSFALEHEFFGESPHISHLINCLLYALLCLLLYKLLLSFFPQNMALLAWIATVLFVFHPIHTEVVASIKNRDELLAVLFALLSGMLFVNSVRKDNILYGILSIVFLVAGMYSKMTVLPFALVFPLLSLMFFNDKINRTFVLSVIFIAVALQFSYFRNDWDKLKFTLIALTLLLLVFIQVKYRLVAKIIDFIKKLYSLNKSVLLKIKDSEVLDQIIKLPFVISDLVYAGVVLVFTGLLLYVRLSDLVFDNYRLWFLLSLLLIFLITRLREKQIVLFLLINYLFYFNSGDQGSDTLFMFFTVALISFQRTNLKFAFITLLIAGVFSVTYDIELHVNPQIIFPVLMYIAAYKKYEKLSFSNIILVIIFAIITINYVLNSSDSIIYILYCGLLLVGFLLFQLRKKQPQISFLALSYIVLISYASTFNLAQKTSDRGAVKLEEQEIINQKSEPINFDRPLHFVETPVNLDAPRNIRIATGMYIFGKYLQKTILPYPMGFYYGYAYITPKTFKDVMPWVMLGVFIFLGLLTLYWIVIKQYVLALGLIIYLAGIFQALGIYVPIPGAMGDRFLFIPSIGFCILLAYPFYKAIGTKWQKPALGLLASILLVYGGLTVQRNFQWKDRITLFESDIQYLNKSAQAQALLGYAYMKKASQTPGISEAEYIELSQKAKLQFEKALAIYPDFLNWWYDKGRIESELGMLDDALYSIKKAIELEPGFLPDPYYNIANIYFYQQKYQDAVYYYQKTIEYGFSSPEIFNSIAGSYLNMGQINSALDVLLQGLQFYPNDFNINLNIGKLYYNLGDIDTARLYFKKAEQINPSNSELNNILNELRI
jgi:tetratricopeptide (TPR) repeat protein